MMGLRPMRSDTIEDSSSDTASAPVEIDSDRLLWAGVSANSCASSGISGCTQYSSAKQEKPPKNRARLLRLKSDVPAAMRELARWDMRALAKRLKAILGLRCNTVQYIFEALFIL